MFVRLATKFSSSSGHCNKFLSQFFKKEKTILQCILSKNRWKNCFEPQRKSLFFLYNLRYVSRYTIALAKEKLNEFYEKQQKKKKNPFNWLQKKKLIDYNAKLNVSQFILALVSQTLIAFLLFMNKSNTALGFSFPPL